jgi:hypothetical protein
MKGTADFTPWLMGHVGELNRLGDLARSIASDPRWPTAGSLETYRDYLEDGGAPPELIDTLRKAWAEFQSLPQ